MLQAFLDWQRATLLNKCAGLTGTQLAERAVPPWSCPCSDCSGT